MAKFEYALHRLHPLPATEEWLNIMGNDGWELTGVLTVQEYGLITETYIYYFKRRTENKIV